MSFISTLNRLFRSGKNSKWKYYLKSYWRVFTPKIFSRRCLEGLLDKAEKRTDRDYIKERTDYYCKLKSNSSFARSVWEDRAVSLREQKMTKQKVYYFDSTEFARYFDQSLKWILETGDKGHTANIPSIVKDRPLVGANANSVILNLDKVRHFLFVNDKKSWCDKKNMAIFRGKLGEAKRNRTLFMERWSGRTDLVDAASVNYIEEHPEWQKGKLTIGEHLNYKFIMSLEGNDVASNLKWVMSSNSIAISPRLNYETWFMEGKLVPNYHFIEVKEDFSDLEERMNYYITHPDEAEQIIRHAHEYVNQFRDKEREKLISLLVLKKYFEICNGRWA